MQKLLTGLLILFLIASAAQYSSAGAIENYDERMQAALSLRKEARFEEAEKLYSLILAENPDDVDALVGRGFCFLRHEDLFEKAEADFKTVIGKTPAYIDAYYGLALIYKRSGRWTDAQSILEKARDSCAGNEKALG